MNGKSFSNGLMVVGATLAACALLVVGAPLFTQFQSRAIGFDSARSRQTELATQLSSTRPAQFRSALKTLVEFDDVGALDLWHSALNNADPQLKREAWDEYRSLQPELSRKQFVPQIARIDASSERVTRIAEATALQATIWTAGSNQTVAAVPPYLIDRLRTDGIKTEIIYDSIAAWQEARVGGDALAWSITPSYQSTGQGSMQIRIAVLDLADRASEFLGDVENVVMREGSRLAYLDIFESDGSSQSIASHIEGQYTRRGFSLAGFYTPVEFADLAPRLFPGKSFEAGRRTRQVGEVHLTLENGKFHTYDQVITEFKALASAHPDLARYVKLGSSFEGREIFALKIGRDASVDDASKPDVLITGLHHAREWISVETPVYIANQLLNGYAADDSIKYLLDRLQVWIVPIVNPDGLTYSQQSPNESVDPVRLWRKNRRPISFGSCASGIGADLNRNYNYQWRPTGDTPCSDYCSRDRSCLNDDIGASDDPSSEIYRGPQPESEPEVKAMKSLMDDPNRHFRAQLDYHNYSQLVLYPWGYAPDGTVDADTLSSLGERISDALFNVDKTMYRPEQAVKLYTLSGSSIDYAYGVNKVAAPFVVEMRPNCCDFTVPESQIPIVNQENWAGARLLLNWAAGPPILESVKAYTIGPDGKFSKLIYSARWSASPDDPIGHRQIVVDTRFAGIAAGRLQVKLQFSKPMNIGLPPRATLGRDAQLDEVGFTAVIGEEGWQKTNYAGDTWVGETVIVEDQNLTSPWQLAVSADDTIGLSLDGVPPTIASYTAGGGHWQNYEDLTGQGYTGGTDRQHAIGPTVRGDYPNILVASPIGGERLAGGDSYTIVWIAPGPLQLLSLSTDGGANFSKLTDNIPSNVQRYDVTMPRLATTRARILLVAKEPVTNSFLIAASQADFTIGANVGSNVDINFVSSEKVDLNWSDVLSDDPPNSASGSSRLIVNLKITNRGNVPILNPFLRVDKLTRNVLLTRDARSTWAEGGRQSIDAGSDNTLSPGETADARMVIGLVSPKKFVMSLQLYGVPSTGAINPADSVNVWSGKPGNR
ncbi:MAG TPA: M14 family metallopeptidase [Blastocatellia bacterium]